MQSKKPSKLFSGANVGVYFRIIELSLTVSPKLPLTKSRCLNPEVNSSLQVSLTVSTGA